MTDLEVAHLPKPFRWYTDKNGRVVIPNDIICFDGGMTEKVYLAEGTEEEYELGINASNEEFLKRNPWRQRELYPLYQYNRTEYEVIGHEDEVPV